MPHDIFISYSSKDKITADAICSRFEESGVRCWYAPRDIQPGDEWASSIIGAIKKSKIMVLIFTDFSNSSPQVLREVGYAADSGVVIIPFKMTANDPQDGLEYYLKSIHWLDAMNSELENAIEELRLLCKRTMEAESTDDVISERTAPAFTENKQSRSKGKVRQGPIWSILNVLKKILLYFVSVFLILFGIILSVAMFEPDESGNYDITVAILCGAIAVAQFIIAFLCIRSIFKRKK